MHDQMQFMACRESKHDREWHTFMGTQFYDKNPDENNKVVLSHYSCQHNSEWSFISRKSSKNIVICSHSEGMSTKQYLQHPNIQHLSTTLQGQTQLNTLFLPAAQRLGLIEVWVLLLHIKTFAFQPWYLLNFRDLLIFLTYSDNFETFYWDVLLF